MRRYLIHVPELKHGMTLTKPLEPAWREEAPAPLSKRQADDGLGEGEEEGGEEGEEDEKVTGFFSGVGETSDEDETPDDESEESDSEEYYKD